MVVYPGHKAGFVYQNFGVDPANMRRQAIGFGVSDQMAEAVFGKDGARGALVQFGGEGADGAPGRGGFHALYLRFVRLFARDVQVSVKANYLTFKGI